MTTFKKIILAALMLGLASSVIADKCEGIVDGYYYTYTEGDNCANGANHCINGAVSAWHYCTDKYKIFVDVSSKSVYCYLAAYMDCSTKPGKPKALENYCQGKENGIHADPQTCMKYINCSNGYTYFMDCPSGLYFNKDKNECDYDTNVDCILHH